MLAAVEWQPIFSSVVGGSALLLSALNYVRERTRRREEMLSRTVADVRIRLEAYPSNRIEFVPEEHRFVIENRGAASALDVQLAFAKLDPRVIQEKEVLPIAELYSGSEVHLLAVFTGEDTLPLDATLTWRDGRGSRERKSLLTPQHVF